MKLQNVEIKPYAFAFGRTLKTSAGEFSERRGWWLELETVEGLSGRGDAAFWPGFGSGAEADILRSLEGIASSLRDVTSLEDLSRLTLAPEARFALETAALDLLEQSGQVPFAAQRDLVPVHALVNDEAGAAKARRSGFRHIKVKVGVLSPAEEAQRLAAIRATLGSEVSIRLDANRAWSLEDARAALECFEEACSPAWLEEPLRNATPHALNTLRGGKTRIAVDESVKNLSDLEQFLAAEAIDGVVLKPMFLGGFQNTLRMAEVAQQSGVSVSLTHALESSVGRKAALKLAKMIPGSLDACGLAGELLGDPMPAPVQGRM